jgi:hypothetical protein
LLVRQVVQRAIGFGDGALGRRQRVGRAAFGDFGAVDVAFEQIEFLLQFLALPFGSQLLLVALCDRLGRCRRKQAERQRRTRQQAGTSQDVYLAFPWLATAASAAAMAA